MQCDSWNTWIWNKNENSGLQNGIIVSMKAAKNERTPKKGVLFRSNTGISFPCSGKLCILPAIVLMKQKITGRAFLLCCGINLITDRNLSPQPVA